MTSFVEVPYDPTFAMRQRANLHAQPPEFFQQFCGGRIPSSLEKAQMIEDAVIAATPARIFKNDLYLVQVGSTPPFVRLTLWRHDRQPIQSWKHLQEIKNQLIGPEHEAVELFPAESRLVDTANEYHLWVHVDPHFRFPFGFGNRCVTALTTSVGSMDNAFGS